MKIWLPIFAQRMSKANFSAVIRSTSGISRIKTGITRIKIWKGLMSNIEFLSFREDPIKATAKYLLELKEKGIPLEKVALVFGGRRPGMFLNGNCSVCTGSRCYRRHSSPWMNLPHISLAAKIPAHR